MIEEAFHSVIKDLEERLSLLGLYMMNVDVGVVANEEFKDDFEKVDDIESLLKSPEKCNIYIAAIFRISDICWSDRVQNPEKHAEEKEFRAIAPTEFEVTLESIKDDILNWDSED
jgi:hypothetical protein